MAPVVLVQATQVLRNGDADAMDVDEEARGLAETKPSAKRARRVQRKREAALEKIDMKSSGCEVDSNVLNEASSQQRIDAEVRQVHLTNIDSATNESDIKKLFKLGDFLVESVDIPMKDTEVGKATRNTGNAFVTLVTPAEARRAIVELQSRAVRGRGVKLKIAKPNVFRKKMAQHIARAKAKIENTKKGNNSETIPAHEECVVNGNDEMEDVTSDALIQTRPTSFGDVLTQYLHQMFQRQPTVRDLNTYVRRGNVIILFANWPTKQQQRGKQKVQKSHFRSSFYSCILGSYLDGLHAVQQVHHPETKDPLQLLLVFGSRSDAELAGKAIRTIRFTEGLYDIAVKVKKYPGLKLGSETYGRGKSVGQPLRWERATGELLKVLTDSIVAYIGPKIAAGDISLEEYSDRSKLTAEPERDFPRPKLGIDQVENPFITSTSSHPRTTSEPSISDTRTFAANLLASFPQLAPKVSSNQMPRKPEALPSFVDASPTITPTNPQHVIIDLTQSSPRSTATKKAAKSSPTLATRALHSGSVHGSSPSDLVMSTTLPVRSTLAQLTPKERELQHRYWGVILDVELARCSTCSREGHMSESCLSHACSNCKATTHFTSACALPRKCSKCGQVGHEIKHCTSKLKMTSDENRCDLCREIGHFEAKCPNFWRTFFPDQVVSLRKISKLSMSCYSCGSVLHWGGDCPSGYKNLDMKDARAPNIFTSVEANRYLQNRGVNDLGPYGKVTNNINVRGIVGENVEADEEEDDYTPAAFLPHTNMSESLAHRFNGGQIPLPPLQSLGQPASSNVQPKKQARRKIANSLSNGAHINTNYPRSLDYASYPPPGFYHSRQRSRSPARQPPAKYRDRNEGPLQRRAFPPRGGVARHNNFGLSPQVGRFRPGQ